MAGRACVRNKESLVDFGDLPFHLVEPILRRIDNVDQLVLIETNSPQLASATAEIWKGLIKRDWPKSQYLEPKNPTSWSKVYFKLVREDKRKQAAAEEDLKRALNKSKSDKEQKQTHILHKVIQVNRQGAPTAGRSRGPAIGGQALKNASARSAADALAVLKRRSAHQSQIRGVTKSMPTHELQQKRSMVMQAPKSMVQEYTRKPIAQPRISAQPVSSSTHQRAAIFAPRTKATAAREQALSAAIKGEKAEQAAREARLRALTGSSAPKSVPASSHSSQPSRPIATATAPSTLRANQSSKPIGTTTAPNLLKRTTPVTAQSTAKPSAAPPKPVQPSPTPATAQPARVASPAKAMMPRKRPAYNPLMPNKRAKR